MYFYCNYNKNTDRSLSNTPPLRKTSPFLHGSWVMGIARKGAFPSEGLTQRQDRGARTLQAASSVCVCGQDHLILLSVVRALKAEPFILERNLFGSQF
jgi:hypothetical protein